jgi:3,2-trans-enoyl-CoA isomerase
LNHEFKNFKKVVACLNGASPAAGCLVALSCDHRIKANNPKFITGLNETALGFAAPIWLAQCFIDAVGRNVGESALVGGILFSPDQALEIGLVDKLCDLDEMENEARKYYEDSIYSLGSSC